MSSIEIPQTKTRRWSGPYLGNYYGSLWRTFNIDLENSPGHITLSRSFVNVADSTDTNLLNMNAIDAFLRTNADLTDRFWALNHSGRLCKTDTVNPIYLTAATWDEDTLVNSPTDARDMTIHENDSDSSSGENFLLVTRDTSVAALNDTSTNVWNANWAFHTGATSLKTGVPHPIEYFPLVRISVVGDGYLVHTIDKNRVLTYGRLVLPTYLQVECIFTTPYRVWILCSGKQGNNGAIVEWDGSAQTYNRIHDAQSAFPMSGVNFNGVPIVVNNRGLILQYDGTGFPPLVIGGQKICFPSYEEITNTFLTTSSIVAIKPRGMTVADDGLIYINTMEPALASQRQLAGIWCLNHATGQLYSKYSLNMGGDTDFGQQLIARSGAIKAINPVDDITKSSYLLAEGQIYSNVNVATPSAIWALQRVYSSTVRHGYFITQYVLSDDITEIWDSIWLKLSAFRSSNDKIIVKARGVNPLLDSNRKHLQEVIAWASGTTFTVTFAAADDTILVGDEIEIIAGKNAGVLAHITTISGAQGSLQTITIDETVIGTSGNSWCRFDRWKKLGTVNDITKYTAPLKIGINSSFIQFKIELRGPAADFDIKSLIINLEQQQAKKK